MRCSHREHPGCLTGRALVVQKESLGLRRGNTSELGGQEIAAQQDVTIVNRTALFEGGTLGLNKHHVKRPTYSRVERAASNHVSAMPDFQSSLPFYPHEQGAF
jgi:hypothetical protein